MSTILADQLAKKRDALDSPLSLQFAVQYSLDVSTPNLYRV